MLGRIQYEVSLEGTERLSLEDPQILLLSPSVPSQAESFSTIQANLMLDAVDHCFTLYRPLGSLVVHLSASNSLYSFLRISTSS